MLCRTMMIPMIVVMFGCASQTTTRPSDSPQTPIVTQTTQADLASIREKAETLAKRCFRDGKDAATCTTLYDDVKDEGNGYWRVYKKAFVEGRVYKKSRVTDPLKDDLSDDLGAQAKKADAAFAKLRDFTVPAPEQASSSPATIITIIEIAKKLYETYQSVIDARQKQAQAEIFAVIDEMKFRELTEFVPAPVAPAPAPN